MPPARLLLYGIAFWALALPGCQTDRDGVSLDVAAALEAYRARLDRRPGRAQVERALRALRAEQLNDLGVSYERDGLLDDAAWAYQEAIWKDPRFAPPYVNLGNVLRQQGRMDEAFSRYRQAMSADPGNFEAVNNFADLCAQERQHLDEAIHRLAPLVEEEGPHQPYGLDTLGWLRHLQGDHRRAAGALEAALRKAKPEDLALRAAAHEHLAAVYEALGREEDAAVQKAEARRLQQLLPAPPRPQDSPGQR